MRAFFSSYQMLLLATAVIAMEIFVDRSLERSPNEIRMASIASIESGKFDDAIENLSEALRKDPENPAMRVELARAYQSRGWDEEALKQYELTVKSAQDTLTHAYYRMGLLAEKAGRIETAVQNYKRAVELNGDLTGAKDRLRSLNR